MALERGPLVYAVEQADNEANIDDLVLPEDAPLTAHHDPNLLEGVTTLTTPNLKAIPYYAWANRQIGAMRVWLPHA